MLKKGKDLFFLQDWQVNPSTNTLIRGEQTKQLEPKAMDVLLLLCNQQGKVLSADEIATQCWGGIDIGDNPVHKAVTQLRKALGDKASAPTYIETIRKRGYHIIAQLDFPLDEELKAEQANWQGTSPFPGLVPFSAKDAQVFFGRNEQIATLLERISNQVNAKHAFTLILGPSGTGKSSLVNAGLLPRLTSENGYNGIGVVSHTSIDFADISQERLLIDIASAMLDWDVNDHPVFSGMSAEGLATQLQNNAAASIQQCHLALKASQQSYSKPQFLLFIDRLEVLLSSPTFSDDEREKGLNLIETLTTSGAIIVISACRNDFYPLVVNHPSLMANKGAGGHFDLLAPSRAELMQIIRLPAIAANLTWSVDTHSATPLEQLLCDEAANNPDALPMLQYTLQELYLQRSKTDELQVSVYQALGGIEGAIGKKAEEVYQSVPAEHQEQLAYLLSLLVTLSDNGKTITSRAARWSQLTQPSQKAFAQALVDSRLFVSHLQNDEPCFSLAHEALLRRWPRASDWIETHRNSLEIKSRIQNMASRWIAEQKSPAYLLPEGKPLLEAQSLQSNATFNLDKQEQALIIASAQKARVRRWFKGSIMSLLCLLTFVAVLMSYQSQQAQNLAQQKRVEAESLLGFMVGEFADKLRSVKRMDLLDGISNKALEYFSQQDDSYGGGLYSLTDSEQNFKAQFQHAQTLMAMGEVAYSRVKNDEAQQAFSSSKVILGNLFQRQAKNIEVLKSLGANAFWLGQLAMDSADFNVAKTHFNNYLKYSQAMVEQSPNNQDAQWELSYAYQAIGGIDTKLQLLVNAKVAFEAALKIQNKIVSELPQGDFSNLYVSDTIEWLAETEEQLGNFNNSIQSRKKVQAILIEMLDIFGFNADILESLAHSYLNQANTLYFLGKYSEADTTVTLSISRFEALLKQDPTNQNWQISLIGATALLRYLDKQLFKQSTAPLISIRDFNRLLDKVEPSSPFIEITIKSYQANDDLDLAKKSLLLTQRKVESLLTSQPTNMNFLYALSNTYLLEAKQSEISRLTRNEGTKKEQLGACKKVIDILEPLITESSNYRLMVTYIRAQDCLGHLDKVSHFIKIIETKQITKYAF
ncbi:MAG: winged helix-turn-helix domain-containing protein [Paraglaciecola sp.]|uniref:nSTAND1 domain-containing NTPase n=1 Tax=Paraglaciecola sp. TaxID=1920173 RepID=UPI0032968847